MEVAHQMGAIAVASGVTVSDLILEACNRLIAEHHARYLQYCVAFGPGNGLPGKPSEPME